MKLVHIKEFSALLIWQVQCPNCGEIIEMDFHPDELISFTCDYCFELLEIIKDDCV